MLELSTPRRMANTYLSIMTQVLCFLSAVVVSITVPLSEVGDTRTIEISPTFTPFVPGVFFTNDLSWVTAEGSTLEIATIPKNCIGHQSVLIEAVPQKSSPGMSITTSLCPVGKNSTNPGLLSVQIVQESLDDKSKALLKDPFLLTLSQIPGLSDASKYLAAAPLNQATAVLFSTSGELSHK